VDEYAKEPKDPEDRDAKLKALQDIQMDPNTAKDPETVKAMIQRKKELMQKDEGMGDKIADMAQSMSKDEFMSKADELGLTSEEAAEYYEKMQGGAHAGKFEGNQFAQAVQKAKAAGMKAGDKFKVGDQEYTLKDAIELAGLQLEDFYSEEEQAYDNQIERIKNLALYQ
jgi:phage-related tail protein